MGTHSHTARVVFADATDSVDFSLDRGELSVEYGGDGVFLLRASEHDRRSMIRIGHLCSFFVSDVKPDRPIIDTLHGLAVTGPDDRRSYQELIKTIRNPDHPDVPEASLDLAARVCPNMAAPVWFGLGGDPRIFLASFSEPHGCWGWITPCRFNDPVTEPDGYRVEWDFTVGRGSQYRHEITRHLEDGALPVVHSIQSEPPIEYRITLFATQIGGRLVHNPPRGADWRAACLSTMGCMFPKQRKEALKELCRHELSERSDLPIFCMRIIARNRGSQPAYAWYRMPMYKSNELPPMYPPFAKQNKRLALDRDTGRCFDGDSLFSVNTLDGAGLPNEEVAVLIEHREEAHIECRLPFTPIDAGRADELESPSFDLLLDDCISYWRATVAAHHRWSIPETGIDERVRAGNAHISINTLGETLRPDTPLLATVGIYAPIGTESSPIIRHLDATGRHDIAARCLDYFFAIQREDGYIQSFNHYDAETGPVLANSFRHYLITGDTGWVLRRIGGIRNACEYLIRRRREEMSRQCSDEPGYGMISGKTADPDEYYHQFTLNAQAVEGLEGAVRLLALSKPDRQFADEVAQVAAALKDATRKGFLRAVADAPLVPTAEGDWVPWVASWPGPRGEVSLNAEPARWFTHGSFHVRAHAFLQLVCSGVVRADARYVKAAVRALENHVLLDYTGPSQPYRNRGDFYYAATGQVGKYLELFYRQLARLQDRETYTFWEHYYGLSTQKIHEEAWFLRQVAWMLCFEERGGLTLLKTAPQAWLSPGNSIEIDRIDTIYGGVSYSVASSERELLITTELRPAPVLTPKRLGIRIPRSRFLGADSGSYDSSRETLELDPTPGTRRVRIEISRR